MREKWKKLLEKLNRADDREEGVYEDLEDRELVIDEEDKKQRITIHAKLPRFYWVVIGNAVVFAAIWILYALCGSHIYSPKTAVREYYGAYADGDWNQVYDACAFPDSEFLSRQSFVNAHSYQSMDSEASQEIIGFSVKLAQKDEISRFYQIDYRVTGSSEMMSTQVEAVRGKPAGIFFRQWEIIPDGLYMENVEIQIPAQAKLTLDGIELSSEYFIATDNNVDIYRVPYLFCGYHTIALDQEGKDSYREIYKAEEGKPLQILPELRLSETTGAEISDFVIDVVDAVYEAAIGQEEFETIRQYFPSDAIGSSRAEDAYEEFVENFAGSSNRGVTKLAIRQMDLNVSGEGSAGFDVKVDMTFSAEEAYRSWYFYSSTKTYSGTSSLQLKVYTNEADLKVNEGIFDFFENMELDEEDV